MIYIRVTDDGKYITVIVYRQLIACDDMVDSVMLYFMSNVKRYQFIKNIVKRDQINIKLDDADHISSA